MDLAVGFVMLAGAHLALKCAVSTKNTKIAQQMFAQENAARRNYKKVVASLKNDFLLIKLAKKAATERPDVLKTIDAIGVVKQWKENAKFEKSKACWQQVHAVAFKMVVLPQLGDKVARHTEAENGNYAVKMSVFKISP